MNSENQENPTPQYRNIPLDKKYCCSPALKQLDLQYIPKAFSQKSALLFPPLPETIPYDKELQNHTVLKIYSPTPYQNRWYMYQTNILPKTRHPLPLLRKNPVYVGRLPLNKEGFPYPRSIL